MKIKFVFIFLIFCLILIYSADNEPAFQTIEREGMTFSWRVNNNMLDIKMKAPTNGWLSVGIDPSKKMKDADYILGCVLSDGKVLIQDHYGSGNLSHKKDTDLGGTDDIKNISAKEDKNSTEISFSISLDSNDKFDKKITKGKHTILLGYSDKDDFKKKHKKWVIVEINI